MPDSRAGGTRLLVTTILAALAVGAVLVIDATMQDDLQDDPVAAIEPVGGPQGDGVLDEERFDPNAACRGPYLPRICMPPVLPEENEGETALNEPVADEPARARKPVTDDELPPVDMRAPEEAALPDRVFASVIDGWHAPKACATAVGAFSGTPTVRVEMDIDKSGRVKDARALDVDGNTEQQLASCLETRARGLRFPPEEVRRETTRDATFVF